MDVKCCPRCSQSHKDLPEEELLNSKNYWDSWSMCPVIGQPIFNASPKRCEELDNFVLDLIDLIYDRVYDEDDEDDDSKDELVWEILYKIRSRLKK